MENYFFLKNYVTLEGAVSQNVLLLLLLFIWPQLIQVHQKAQQKLNEKQQTNQNNDEYNSYSIKKHTININNKKNKTKIKKLTYQPLPITRNHEMF